VLEGWLVMTRLARAVVGCISATFLTGAASIAGADTFTYNLNNSLKAQTEIRRSFPTAARSATQGTRSVCSHGLSLSGTGIFDEYS
jgi:hypothetical protein